MIKHVTKHLDSKPGSYSAVGPFKDHEPLRNGFFVTPSYHILLH